MASVLNPHTGVRSQVSGQEWETRVDLAAAYRLVAHYGWTDMIFTHLSARVPGPEDHFLINPYGLMFDEITASNLVKVDLDGNIVMSSDYDVNPAGFCIHSAIHMARHDAKAVMHLHTDDGAAVSAMDEGLMPLTQTAMVLLPQVAYHDYEGVALDLDERERLVKDIGDKRILLLRNHGTLAAGESVSSCFMLMYLLERACSMQVRAMSSNKLRMPSQEAITTSSNQGNRLIESEGLHKLAWPALLRMLDRADGSYRD
jgi:ribulose-5-phosphate 4-epimerase/fuculose-1-phosphate aldolase